jgi:subtilisin family serine protease
MKFFAFIFLTITSFTIVAQNSKFNNTTIVVKIKLSHFSKNGEYVLNYINNIFYDKKIEVEPVFKHFDNKKLNIPKCYNLSCFYKIKFDNKTDLQPVLAKLNNFENIEYAEPYPISIVFDQPDDPYQQYQYYLQKIKAFDAFDVTHGNSNIVIGIVDSGFDMLHEDLKDNFKYNYGDTINNIDDDMDGYIDNYYGWDVADNNMNPQSLENIHGAVNYHGTRVAGLASAVTANEIGIAGVGYKTKILPVKAMDSTGYIVAGYEGIVYAADHGCNIINCSWGSNFPSKFAQEVINYAVEYRNCLIVAAAGNKNAAVDGRPDTRWYPASYNNVLSVAATSADDILWSGSSFAPTVDVCAPGQNIYSTYQFSSYKTGSGTSYAAPITAGVAALLKAVMPKLTSKQLAAQIRITSDIIDTIPENEYYTKQMGYGRINAYRAVTVTDLPAIEIDSFCVTTNKNNTLLSGDTLYVSFSAQNLLAQVSNTVIRVTTNSEFIEPVNNFFNTGDLKTLESVNNFDSPMIFKVNSAIPSNSIIRFVFEMNANGYDDFAILEDTINLNYVNISSNGIATTFTSNGRIGFADAENKMGEGLVYKNVNLLNNSGVIVATSSSDMASALFDVNNFITTKNIDTITVSSEITGTTKYETNDETLLNIEIIQTSIIPIIDNNQTSVIHIYKLYDKEQNTIKKLKLAQFINWDLYNAKANKAGYNSELNLFYTYTSGNQVLYAGMCLLNNNISAVPYGFDLISGGNGGIDITQGFSNDLKWIAMTNSRPQAGSNGDTINIATLLTSDYFNIDGDDTVEIAFAEIIGDNYNDLISKTIAIKNSYNAVGVFSKYIEQISLYPNPVNNILNIETSTVSGNLKIDIYNESGQLVFTSKFYKKRDISIDVSNLKESIYIIKINDGKNIAISKFIKKSYDRQ